MRLISLQLNGYRNYARSEIDFGPGLNVFLGKNAQGKTNLLESIAVLALSSSPRARRDLELIASGSPGARLQAVVERRGRQVEIEVRFAVQQSGPGGRASRTIRVDGVARRALDLPGELRVVLFWPDDLALVKGGPEHRRRFLNTMLVQVEPTYARTLARYTRVIEQRNSLLKRVSAGIESDASLDAWDQEAGRLGDELTLARSEAVADISGRARIIHAQLSSGERLEVGYRVPDGSLADTLARERSDDIRRGSTGSGPHRDDIDLTLDGRDARGFASQGQQRTVVVSLKLAEAAVVEARTGESPILLLDDVLSELDAARREALLAQVAGGGQVVVTSVEADPFPEALMDRAVVRTISGGAVISNG